MSEWKFQSNTRQSRASSNRVGKPSWVSPEIYWGFCLNVIERHLRDGAGQMTLMMLWSVCCWRRSDVWCMCFCWTLKLTPTVHGGITCLLGGSWAWTRFNEEDMLFALQLILEYMNDMTVGGQGLSPTGGTICHSLANRSRGGRGGLGEKRPCRSTIDFTMFKRATRNGSHPSRKLSPYCLCSALFVIEFHQPKYKYMRMLWWALCFCLGKAPGIWLLMCACLERSGEKTRRQISAWYQVPPEDGEEDSIRRTAECTVTEKMLGHNSGQSLTLSLISIQLQYGLSRTVSEWWDNLPFVGQSESRRKRRTQKEEACAIISC